MKKSIFALFCFAFILMQSSALADTKKYEIKSGIVSYDITMKVGRVALDPLKTIIYFDDYGKKECKETYKNGVLSESYFSDGKNIYKTNYAKKAAYKIKTAYKGTEQRVSWDEYPQSAKDYGLVKKLPNMTIAGKNCEVFLSYSGSGNKNTMKVAGWKGILLLGEYKENISTSLQKAIQIHENVAVPSEKFKIPAGFPIK